MKGSAITITERVIQITFAFMPGMLVKLYVFDTGVYIAIWHDLAVAK